MSLPVLSVPVAIVAQVACLLLTGAALGESRARRALAWSIALSGLLLPWCVVDVPPMRAALGLLSLFGPMRTVELALRPALPPLAMRLAIYALPMDARTMRRAAPRFDAALAAHTLAHALVAAAGVALVMHAELAGVVAPLVRLLGALVAMYGASDAISNGLRIALAAVGVETGALQHDPVLAESAGDFWGRRWNRAVGGWLRTSCFVPVARRYGTRWGALAAFGASAVIHFVPVLIALGPWPALACGGYFVVEALFILFENRLRVPRWRRPLRHAWAALAVVGPSPLFLIPLLEVFGAW